MSYSSNPFIFKLFQLTALTLALTLAGCGSDGVDSLPPPFNPGSGSESGAPVRNTNISAVNITDSLGQPTRVITSSGSTASVKVTDGKGEPISGALVTFGTDAAITSVLFGNTNGTVLTNADGIATMTLKAVGTSDSGSYSLSATTTYDGVDATTPAYFFSVQSANLIFDEVRLEQNRLPYGGSTDITGLVKNSATMHAQKDVEVSFAATCGTVSSAATNVLGFRATYNAGTCEGSQTIVATIEESGANIRLPVTIDQRTALGALSLKCISGDTPSFPGSSADGSGADGCANEVLLGVVGSTLPSVRSVEFVVSKDDKPFANERVKVELLSAPNDFGIGSARNQQPLTLNTDNAGRIKVPLYAGNATADNIKLRATLISRVDVTAIFENIGVVSSVSTQSGFTVTPTKNVLAATETTTSTAGVTTITRLNDSTTLNVIARDGNNEFVNGSTINFIAEGGTLSSNFCVVNNGRCQVTLSTSGILPDDRRVTVLSYTTGTGVQQEINGNGIFLDEDENGIADANEFKLPSITGVIFRQFVVGFADTTPTFSPSFDDLTENRKGTMQLPFKMYGANPQDSKKISMPSGTQVQVRAFDKTSGDNANCTAQITSKGLIGSILTVPMLVDLSTPDGRNMLGNNQDDSDKSYVIRAQQCSAGDEIKLTVITPSPNSKTTVKTIAIIK
ncbi:hypothetical protein [Psychrobacter frigidicola]|uniref:hypothetical protein n=1 Tax=Psychrobacter frigidicola TaxID=45611 RepID=UPI00191B3351|nr:hypothetical protein [Psychrobacter frigidicola]